MIGATRRINRLIGLVVCPLALAVGSTALHGLVKDAAKKEREPDGAPSLTLDQDEVKRLQALLLQKGIHAGSDGNAGIGIELVAALSPLRPATRMGSTGSCSAQFRGIVVTAAADLISYAEENAVTFEVDAGETIAKLQLDMGTSWVGKQRYLLELFVENGSGSLAIAAGEEPIAAAGLEETESLLTDPFLVSATPDQDFSPVGIEIQAGETACRGTFREIRLYRLR